MILNFSWQLTRIYFFVEGLWVASNLSEEIITLNTNLFLHYAKFVLKRQNINFIWISIHTKSFVKSGKLNFLSFVPCRTFTREWSIFSCFLRASRVTGFSTMNPMSFEPSKSFELDSNVMCASLQASQTLTKKKQKNKRMS